MSSRSPRGRAFYWTHLFPWILSSLLAVPLGTAASMLPPAERPQTGPAVPMSKDWSQTKTPNFTAVSNAPANTVRTILERLEIFHSSVFTEFLKNNDTKKDPVLVYIFRDESSFSRFKPRDEKGEKRQNVGGYFLSNPDMSLIVLPRYQEDASLNVIFHEYYHYLAHRVLPDLPPWLNEGLAEFYSSSEFDPKKGESLIGKVIPQRLQQLRQGILLPLEQMLARESAMKILYGKDSQKISLFYARSWLLVHYLLLGHNGSRSDRILDYLNSLKLGISTDKAFQTAFGVTLDIMEQELQAYSIRLTYPAMRFTRPPETVWSDSASGALTEIEAEYVQGDLLLRVGAYEDADRMLTKILEREPSHISAQISLAQVRSAQERYSEALDILNPIVAADPGNFRAHLSFAAASLQDDRLEDALREYKRAAEINRQASAAFIGMSLAALALGRQAEADEAMSRLQRLEPNPRWYSFRAYEEFKRGNFSAAVSDVRSVIEQGGSGAESAPYAAFLGAICYHRLQQPVEADKLLKEISPEISEGSWTATVMKFMQGELSSEQFLSRAKDVFERTEAHAYAGIMDLLAGNREKALLHLRWVKEKGSRNYVEYGMAAAELKRLEADGRKAGAKSSQ